jgi:hypothetical protein
MNSKEQYNLVEERYSAMTTEEIMETINSIEYQLEVESIIKERGSKWVCSAVAAKRSFTKELAARKAIKKQERSDKVKLNAQQLKHERHLLNLSSGKAFHDIFKSKVKKIISDEEYKALIEETKEEVDRISAT